MYKTLNVAKVGLKHYQTDQLLAPDCSMARLGRWSLSPCSVTRSNFPLLSPITTSSHNMSSLSHISVCQPCTNLQQVAGARRQGGHTSQAIIHDAVRWRVFCSTPLCSRHWTQGIRNCLELRTLCTLCTIYLPEYNEYSLIFLSRIV